VQQLTIAKTQPWNEITRFYRSLSEANPFFRPMMTLAEQIETSRYAQGLFAWTSMHTLCIAQTEEPNSNKEVLRISLDTREGALVLDFQETASTLPKYQHWIRRCSPSEGFSRLEQFLRLKKWFE
jgi:hypothetical protein